MKKETLESVARDANEYEQDIAIQQHLRGEAPAAERTSEAKGIEIPNILFCGWDVFYEMSEDMKRRTSPENVSDVLDTLVKIMKKGAKSSNAASQVPAAMKSDSTQGVSQP